MTFVEELATNHGVATSHPLVQYLVRKTRAADRGSKARRSLGNVYALYVLAEDVLENRTSRFTDLLGRMRSLPFGSKLQNHPLDNRLNDEFTRQLGLDDSFAPVEPATINGQKARVLSRRLLNYQGADPVNVARFVMATVEAYVDKITANQSSALEEIQAIETPEDLAEFFDLAFAANSDARLFEIASYVLLAEHYRGQYVYIGTNRDNITRTPLALFRTGRTNANDGGIDFLLQPLGRLYQVTETLDFRKYFLDFEKVNRFPISFVIKIEADKSDVIERIRRDAERSGQYSQELLDLYMSLFQEIFTLYELQEMAGRIPATSIQRIKNELSLQFQLEFGLLD
ncbi:TPA: hypothetical protein ACU9T0_001055 [Burkholderia cenocepacia]